MIQKVNILVGVLALIAILSVTYLAINTGTAYILVSFVIGYLLYAVTHRLMIEYDFCTRRAVLVDIINAQKQSGHTFIHLLHLIGYNIWEDTGIDKL